MGAKAVSIHTEIHHFEKQKKLFQMLSALDIGTSCPLLVIKVIQSFKMVQCFKAMVIIIINSLTDIPGDMSFIGTMGKTRFK